MMAGSGGSAVAGGSALHIPVLGRPAIDFLKLRDGGVYIDATFGAGGYTRAMPFACCTRSIATGARSPAVSIWCSRQTAG